VLDEIFEVFERDKKQRPAARRSLLGRVSDMVRGENRHRTDYPDDRRYAMRSTPPGSRMTAATPRNATATTNAAGLRTIDVVMTTDTATRGTASRPGRNASANSSISIECLLLGSFAGEI
jgi:hypothetical protein